MNNLYRVYTIRMAHYLTEKGFEIVRTSQDVKKPQFLNWYFEYTPELQAAINEYMAMKP